MITKLDVDSLEVSKEDKLSQLVKEFHPKIFNYCYNILRNTQDAEDAVQEVFIKAIRSKKLMTIDHYGSWLYKIAYNHCLNQVRRKKLIRFISFGEMGKNTLFKESYENKDDTDIELEYILSKLKPKERALIVLRIIEDKDFNEIGSILDTSSSTARKRYERVKNKIQKIIERGFQVEEEN